MWGGLRKEAVERIIESILPKTLRNCPNHGTSGRLGSQIEPHNGGMSRLQADKPSPAHDQGRGGGRNWARY
ncbi:MAG: hypothetical protein EBS30_12810 [Planctomycetes bacterium]|nr:hypothetical protein [Planctomycetota bacterium]